MAATTVGILAMVLTALPRSASGESLAVSGSKSPRIEMAVRKSAMGFACLGSDCSSDSTAGSSGRAAESCAVQSASRLRVGKVPLRRR